MAGGMETSATHAPNHLFCSGQPPRGVENLLEGIMVINLTPPPLPCHGKGGGTDAFVNNARGWFFTYTETGEHPEKDKDYPLTAAMK